MLARLAAVLVAAALVAPGLAQAPEGAEPAKAEAFDRANPLKSMGGFMPQKVYRPDVAGARAFLEKLYKTEDPEDAADLVSFPVLMVTTDARGAPVTMTADRQTFVKMMQSPAPAREAGRMIHRGRAQLSWVTDSLVWARTSQRIRSGGRTWHWQTGALIVHEKDGWKLKTMVEGGYGAMMPSRPTD